MPARIRHSPLGAGLSLADLNILPFLAPRLLQAWPRSRRGQRAQSTSSVRLDSPILQPLDDHMQSSSASAAARQPTSSRDVTGRSLSNYGLSHGQIHGQRRSIIKQASIKPPRSYRKTRTGDTGSSNQDRTVVTHLQRKATDETPIIHDESFNLTRKGVTGPYFNEAHLDMLYDFMKAYRNGRNMEEDRQFFGDLWEAWFDKKRNEKQSKHVGIGSKRTQQLESFANFDPSADVFALRVEWKRISLRYRNSYWPGLMLDILCKRPDDALKFFVATLTEELPYHIYIEDCLGYIVDYHLYSQSQSPISSNNFAVLFGVVNDLLTKFTSEDFCISSYAIYHICKHANRLQTETLYETLSRGHHGVTPNIRLYIVHCLARRGATDSAVSALGSMNDDEVVDFTEPKVAAVCATLLRCSQQNPEAVHSESHIYSLLLEWGIRPSIIFYTILAHNAFESWDHDTAWKIYDMMIENGIEPSNHTYSIFLHDAKNREDKEALENILEGVKENNIRNEHVATDLLHALLRLHESRAQNLRGEEARAVSESLFQRMLLLYSTYFELDPLADFAPEYFTIDWKPSSEAEGRRMHPDRATLSLMVSAAVRCRMEQSELPLLYNRFKRLIDAGHPDFVNVAREVNVFNAFIRAMGQHRDTLPFTTQILGDMLGAEARKAQPRDVDSKKIVRVVSPSVQTWSILVHAFMGQGQPRAAEKIVSMMESRGMKPNKVTWTTLITGYLHMQDMAGAMRSYDRAREEGCTFDEDIHDKLGLSGQRGVHGQQSEDMPRTTESGESDEQADTQSPISSPDGVRSLRYADFQFKATEVSSHGAESDEQADTQSPISSPDGVRSPHYADFQSMATEVSSHGAGSDEWADVRFQYWSPDGVRDVRFTDFKHEATDVFLHGAELKRVEIVEKTERLLKATEGNPELAHRGWYRVKFASEQLEKLRKNVDRRLRKLEEASGI